ncbi:MAG: bacteriophage abortive infection AbiH family protein [Paludibacteraceae bacterium]|nr:bacteriophage abortive infection AbiH family protein [Paludibacteraceae bacterium]
MKDTLYIIGNGFDLKHELPTKYSDFRDAHVQGNATLKSYLVDIYGYENIKDEMWWCNFEEMLGKVNYLNLIRSHNGEAMAPYKVQNLVRNLPLFFGNWIKSVNSNINVNFHPLLDIINNSSLYFTFNYTLLLEKSYNINADNICHIHNSVIDFAKDEHAIIVGHGANYVKLMKHAEDSRAAHELLYPNIDSINQEIEKGAKNVTGIIELHNETFQKYTNIKHFIIMGFSLNEIDKPYMEKIIEVNHDINAADWTIYYHADGENESLKKKLMNLGIIEKNIKEPIYW